MRKTVIAMSAMLCVCTIGLAYAQAQEAGKPKIAVYAAGGKTPEVNSAIGTYLLTALVEDGKYRPVERTDAFLAQIDKEHATLRSGLVDERQITDLGKQFGVKFVCIANITEAFGSNSVSARIINVETAEVTAMGKVHSPLKDLTDLKDASNRVAKAMLTAPGGKGTGKLAVYVTGLNSENESRAFGTEILSELIRDSTFRAVERSDAFLAEVAKEQAKQRTKAIDDNQISKLGIQFGVQYVCVANVMVVMGETLVSARIVDVKTAEIKASGQVESELESLRDLAETSVKICDVLYKQMTGKTRAGGSSSGNSFTDARDGKTYRTVRIGRKVWMAENLNYKTGNSWCYEDKSSNCSKYGRLYDWNTARSACPSGWRLPSRKDWDDLGQAAGGTKTPDSKGNIDWYGAGKKLKSSSGWNINGDGTDEFVFSALPGGYRYTDGSFSNVGYYGSWWSATESGSSAYYRNMSCSNDNVLENTYDKSYGFSLRCRRD